MRSARPISTTFPIFWRRGPYGLGAPTIILDTTFKVYRVANQFYSAACDSLVPRQTSALAERDGPAMVRATWLAAGLVRASRRQRSAAF